MEKAKTDRSFNEQKTNGEKYASRAHNKTPSKTIIRI